MLPVTDLHCTFKILPIMDPMFLFFSIKLQKDLADMQILINVSELVKFFVLIIAIWDVRFLFQEC